MNEKHIKPIEPMEQPSHTNRRPHRLFAVFFGVSVASLLLALGLAARQPAATAAPTAVTWPTIVLTPVVTSGLSEPVHVNHAGDGSGRLFIVERVGRIRIFKNGTLLPTPFLDIVSRVESVYAERGLLSVAFPPDYSSKHHFYVYYTKKTSGDLIVARYNLTGNPDVADVNSEQVVLSIPHSDNPNHDGGQLQFGRDGFLYMGTGDGGGGGDQPNNAQNKQQLLGKMLRLDVETGNSLTYTVPVTNPFVGNAAYRPEIWALGLRNPWRFSFDRLTGDMYIGDVGQSAREEIDFEASASSGGLNYGWRCYEGNITYNTSGCASASNYTFPIADYDHSLGCAVVGGYVYRGARYILPKGIYFYSDNCSGRIWGLKFDSGAWQNTQLLDSPYSVSSFGEDEAGNLYVAHLGGAIYELISTENFNNKLYLPIIKK